ncbi:MAG: hypothetical protein V4857_17355 [Pseudomonadota bacterium]
MNAPLHTSQLSIHFSVSAEHAFNALEAVLAIARRGGLSIGALKVEPAGPAGAHVVWLELRASEEDPLALFLARLQGVFDIDDLCAQALPERRAA